MEKAALAVWAAEEEKKATVSRPPNWGGLLIVHISATDLRFELRFSLNESAGLRLWY